MAPAPRRRRSRAWGGLSAAILVVGVVGSVVAATGARAALDQEDRHAFAELSADTIGQVDGALQRAMDLTASARTLLAFDPHLGNAEIARWVESVDASTRHPESQGFQFIARVRSTDLASYAAAASADPNPGATRFDPAGILPAGSRPEYCLTRLIQLQGAVASIQQTAPEVQAQTDWCATAFGRELRAATDRGTFVVASAPALLDAISDTLRAAFGIAEGETTEQQAWDEALRRSVFVFAPVYRTGATPSTISERRREAIGWMSGAFDVGMVLDRALDGRDGLTLHLSRPDAHLPFAPITAGEEAEAGHAVDDSHSRQSLTQATKTEGGWLVTVDGAPAADGVDHGTASAGVFGAGAALSVLTFLLLRVLTGSRNRALDLVEQRTGELRHQALHDALTGLPNRALVLDRAEQLLARARREHSDVSVLFIDLDHFKDINDSLGHAAGDELLVAVARRFSAALRATDTVGRLGGDEFVVVAENEPGGGGPELVAQRLLDVLREPFHLEGSEAPRTVTASVGVASGHADAQALLRDADIALYEAKDAGRACFVRFEHHMHRDVNDRVRLEAELRLAVERGELLLHYQPTFGIRDAETTGVEALLRWRHPTRGVIGPSEFLPLLESTGLIVPVGRWVFQEACRQAAAWHADGFPIVMAVNASARQLADGDLPRDVEAALGESGLDAGHLVIEITESTLMRDATEAVQQLTTLKDLGVRIAIDDFGTGYSSLAYLRQFPVDILKIDQAFIADLDHSEDAAAIVHALIALGKTLGLETVAEGIEEAEQLDRLRSERCDSGQGYLVSRPIPPEEMGEVLARMSAGQGTRKRRGRVRASANGSRAS